jgi:hypothetical protein
VSSQTTDTKIEVYIYATSRCPVCGKRVEIKRTMHEEALVTGNTTQMASYHAKEMRAMVQSEIIQRGWTGEMCGGCRDKDPAERSSRRTAARCSSRFATT